MKVTSDPERYAALQAALVAKIVDAVRGHVRLVIEGRVAPDLGEITKDIVFSVTSILDGVEEEGSHVPMVAFATGEARDELIVADAREGSWMHEYADG